MILLSWLKIPSVSFLVYVELSLLSPRNYEGNPVSIFTSSLEATTSERASETASAPMCFVSHPLLWKEGDRKEDYDRQQQWTLRA